MSEFSKGDSLLPPLPAERHFVSPLHAGIARAYWENAEFTSLTDALVPTLLDMDPRDVFASREHFSCAYDPLDDEEHTLVDEALGEMDTSALEVDRAGVIIAKLGTILNFKWKIIKMIQDDLAGAREYDEIYSSLGYQLHEAFYGQSHNDDTQTEELYSQFTAEVERREARAEANNPAVTS